MPEEKKMQEELDRIRELLHDPSLGDEMFNTLLKRYQRLMKLDK